MLFWVLCFVKILKTQLLFHVVSPKQVHVVFRILRQNPKHGNSLVAPLFTCSSLCRSHSSSPAPLLSSPHPSARSSGIAVARLESDWKGGESWDDGFGWSIWGCI
ncbi:hypothetical protein Droror1_Dr00023900 [Drosera rotundifolia]